MLRYLIILLLVLPALGQLPAAPAPTTCTKGNGKPCPKWEHWLIGQYPLTPRQAAAQDQYLSQLHQDDLHWYSLPVARRSNSQLLRSKVWWLSMAGGGVALGLACSRVKTSHEHLASELPAELGAYGLGYAAGRGLNLPTAWVPGIFAIQHYLIAAAR